MIERELTLGERFQRADWALLGLGVLLAALGTLVVDHASEGQRIAFGALQLRWLVIGLAACLLMLAVPYRRIVDLRYLWYALGVLLLLAVLFVGRGKSAGRWIELAGFRLQPSELMKLVMVVTLAGALRYEQGLERERRFVLPLLLTLLPVLLVLKQPDLGTGLLFLPLLLALLYASGVRRAALLGLLAAGVAGLLVLWFVPGLLHGYQRVRFEAFLRQDDPELVRSYNLQLHESKTVVGTGGLLGQGLGESAEESIAGLPERHSDFAFPVFAHAFGLGGVTVLLLLLLLFLWLLLRTAQRVREPSGRLLAVGAWALFAVQALVNMAMTVGVLPIVGMPLPFVSYGGSSMLTSFLALGLVLNVGAERAVEFGRADFT
jgi:rod shape determining protein RodA